MIPEPLDHKTDEMTEAAKPEEKPTEKKDIFAASMPASGNCTTKMKFGVLIGLMEVGEISNNDVVDTVLNLVRIAKLLHYSFRKCSYVQEVRANIFNLTLGTDRR